MTTKVAINGKLGCVGTSEPFQLLISAAKLTVDRQSLMKSQDVVHFY